MASFHNRTLRTVAHSWMVRCIALPALMVMLSCAENWEANGPPFYLAQDSFAVGGGSLSSNRDRLFDDYAQRMGRSNEVCELWDWLDPSAEGTFLANTHRLWEPTLGSTGRHALSHTTALYAVIGAGSGNGGIDNNRLYLSMDDSLKDALHRANNNEYNALRVLGNGDYWRESHDGTWRIIWLGGIHAPFTGSVESENGGPRGQMQYWRDPPDKPNWGLVCRPNLGCIQDENMVELDQDYAFVGHPSNTEGTYSGRTGREMYEAGHPGVDFDWVPLDCDADRATCGDGVCEPLTEDCGVCPGDCPCSDSTSCQANGLGNFVCASLGGCETLYDCPLGATCEDGLCLIGCGDGICAPGVEDCGTCIDDCPCAAGSDCESNQCVLPDLGGGPVDGPSLDPPGDGDGDGGESGEDGDSDDWLGIPHDGDYGGDPGDADDDDADEYHGPVDTDNDGIPDHIVGGSDDDGDGLPNFLDNDSDGDGLPDLLEGTDDDDGDGLPNFIDTDSDGDGIDDVVEGDGDSDGDGIPDFLDTDSDGDGIDDVVEGSDDSDGDGVPDFQDDDPVPGGDDGYIPEICDDGVDNDGDSHVDCWDIDCSFSSHCVPEGACNDGLDGDGDTLVDCDDDECLADPVCSYLICGYVGCVPPDSDDPFGDDDDGPFGDDDDDGPFGDDDDTTDDGPAGDDDDTPGPTDPPGANTSLESYRVSLAYEGILGRAADPSGLAHYEGQLQAGQSVLWLCRVLVASGEFLANRAQLSPSEMARELYLGILGREPDPGGLASTIAAIQNGQLAERAAAMVVSNEATSGF